MNEHDLEAGVAIVDIGGGTLTLQFIMKVSSSIRLSFRLVAEHHPWISRVGLGY